MATRAEWTKRVQRWEKSGQSAEAFAAREGFKAKQLYWWRWKLRATPAAPRPAEPLTFLPVRVVDAPAPAPPPPSLSTPIEITLPNGLVVRVTADIDPAKLARVLTAAAEASPTC